MNFIPPTPEKIIAGFPELASLDRIAEGGFKVVYRAVVKGKKEVFKLVCLPKEGQSDDEKAYRKESLGRIRREVELLGKFQRLELVKLGSLAPRTVSIDGDEYVGYTEEFLEGKNLWEILRAKGPKPTEVEGKRLLLVLLKAIEELWGHRVIHRDIKPANVIKMASSTRPFVLLDLGIAYGLLDTALTHNAASIPATPRYLAPEMVRPDFRKNLDYRSDLYTAALTVFEYSAQIHPLAKTAEDLIQTVSRALYQPPRHLKNERPDFSAEFCGLIDQLLKKKPALRPSNLTGLIAKMEEAS